MLWCFVVDHSGYDISSSLRLCRPWTCVFPGCPYEFVKWRAKKYGIAGSYARFEWPEKKKCDYAIMLDSLEHLYDWKEKLLQITNSLQPTGSLICNFLLNDDHDNNEHVMMDKGEFLKYMLSIGFYPMTTLVFQRREVRA